MLNLIQFNRQLYLTLLTLFFVKCSFAQLVVTPSADANSLAQQLAGSGVFITNVTLVCPANGAGEFNFTGNSDISISSGIILTSGNAIFAAGPNNATDAGVDAGAPGDVDLQNLITANTNDACVLEFDFVPVSDAVSFTYVFASEEYEEYFCSDFNDVFAFFITGPNPAGGNYNNQNIALIPGTNTPVTINNVGPGSCNGIDNAALYEMNTGNTLQYDGWTLPLVASAAVIPCETYHFKLGVADAFDGIFDSGVFFEEGSFSSTFAVTCNGEDITESCNCFVCPGETATIELLNVPNFGWDWTDPTGDLNMITGPLVIATPSQSVNTYMVSGACGINMLDKNITVTVSNTDFSYAVDCANQLPGDLYNININVTQGQPPFSYTIDNGPQLPVTGSSFSVQVPNLSTVNVEVFDNVGCNASQEILVDCCMYLEGNCIVNTNPQLVEGCNLAVVPAAETDVTLVFADYNNCVNTLFFYEDVSAGVFCDLQNPLQLIRTYTIADDLDNNSILDPGEPFNTCVQTFQLVDTQVPLLSVPVNVTINCNESPVDLSLTGEAASNDNCSVPVVSFTDDFQQACGNTGIVARTWTAVDDCNNMISNTQTISIVDIELPTFFSPADITIACDQNPLDLMITGQVANENDNCANIVVDFQDSFSQGCGNTGVILRTWLATDDCDNTSAQTQSIALEDISGPLFSLPEDVTISCDQNATDLLITGNITDLNDNCSDASVTFQDQFQGDCGTTGIITRIWTATDLCNNQTTLTQTITVTDVSPPQFTVPADITIACEQDPLDLNITGNVIADNDNCSAVFITFQDAFTPDCGTTGTIVRSWSAADACNNITIFIQNIVIGDIVKPVLSVPVDITISCTDDPLDFNLTGYAASTDLCGLPTLSYEDVFVMSCGTTGSVFRTWTAVDDCNNMISNTQTITIIDIDSPSFTAPQDITISCDQNPEDLSLTGYVSEEADNCNGAVIDFQDTFIPACGNTGLVVRNWIVADTCGNSNSAVQNITIQDTILPSFVAPADLTINCTENPLDLLITGQPGTVLDDCSSIQITFSDVQTDSCGNSATIERTWLAVDACGNETTMVQLITTQDVAGPVFVVPADITINCGQDITDLSVAGNVTDISDDCSEPFISFEDLVLNDCGDIERNWKATDACGNENILTQRISVVDNIVPGITCLGNLTFQLGSGECERVIVWDLPLVSDNCDADPTLTQVQGLPNGSAFDYRDSPFFITYEAMDDCGNRNYCSFIVYVLPVVPDFDLVCNDLINLSLDDNCEAMVNPDFFLEGPGPFPCYDLFDIELFADEAMQIPLNLNENNDLVNIEYVGQVITVLISIDGNSCWSRMLVEGRIPPEITCPESLDFFCSEFDAVLNGDISTGEPVVNSYCYEVALLPHEDITEDNGCNGKTIYRTWLIAYDPGYGTELISCTQTIYFESPVLADVVFPQSLIFECAAEGGLSPQDLHEAGFESAFPYLVTDDGNYILDNSICNLGASFQDRPVTSICGTSYEFLRVWTLLDWCSGEDIVHLQNIKIMDQISPELNCLENLEFYTVSPQNCEVQFQIPFPEISDECSGFTVSVHTPSGTFILDENVPTLLTLTAGIYELIYDAVDECGNVALGCKTNVNIIDAQGPVAICDLNTVVSLNEAVEAIVCAATFDDGSYDACNDVVIMLKKMDAADNTPFEDCVGYTCSDLDDGCEATLELRMRVYDITGDFSEEDNLARYSECAVLVHLINSSAPILTCPEHLSFGCKADYTEIPDLLEIQLPGTFPVYNENELLGFYPATVNCGDARIDVTMTGSLDDCREGSFTRRWVLSDDCGRMDQCFQAITVERTEAQYFSGDSNPVDEDDILWPANIADLNCENLIDNSDLTAVVNTGEPQLVGTDDNCSLHSVSYDDQIFTDDPDACFVVFRTWKVVDWCQFVPGQIGGEWINEQIIRIIDQTAPVFISDCGQELSIGDTDGDCQQELSFTAEASDNCGQVDYRWTIDADLDGSIDYEGEGSAVSRLLPFGEYQLSFYAADRCGNEASCNNVFTIFDNKKPSPVCNPGFSTVVMPSSGEISLNAASFNASSFDTCSDSIYYRINKVELQSGQSVLLQEAPETDVVTFDCSDIGDQYVQVWAIDETGNADYCLTPVHIQDPDVICSDPLFVQLAGTISTELEERVENVSVFLEGAVDGFAITETDGYFGFEHLPVDQNYVIIPEKNNGFLNGVTTYDLVLISKHILGVEQLSSPYKIIAADVNLSNHITTLDLVKLRRLILGVEVAAGSTVSWRFVEKTFVFQEPQNPWAGSFPEVVSYNGITSSIINADFIGIKIGDVNNSVIPNMLAVTNDRQSATPLIFDVQNQIMKKEEVLNVAFTVRDCNEIQGGQFTLKFDIDAMQFERISGLNKDMTEENFGLNRLEEGLISCSWHNTAGQKMKDGTTLFNLNFYVKKNLQLSEVLTLNDQIVRSEAYRADIAGLISIRFVDQLTVGRELSVHQNQPNPWNTHTIIPFEVTQAGKVSLEITTISGRIFLKREQYFEAGSHSFNLTAEQQSEPGIYYYKLSFNGNKQVRKMVVY